MSPVSWQLLPENVGVIFIRSFASSEAVTLFDAALSELQTTDALIIDVRNNGGGDTSVARPIMGRFINVASTYVRMAKREGAALGEQWDELVEPRGPWTYEKPVVVAVDRFSVSMAEGFAIGMHGLGRAEVVGTRMAGVRTQAAHRAQSR